MKKTKELLQKPEFHVFLFVFFMFLLFLPFLNKIMLTSLVTVFYYFFLIWGVLVFILFIISKNVCDSSAADESNYEDYGDNNV